jgi:LysM repeat protein
MISLGEREMKQAKRLFYVILLNVIISMITVGVVLQLWEKDHPPLPLENSPVVIIVTPTQLVNLPIVGNNLPLQTIIPMSIDIPITGTLLATPTMQMLTYRVKEGDFLGALAIQFNVSVTDIMAVNNLSDPDSLYIGQLINIPTGPLPTSTPTHTSVPPTSIASATPRPSATSIQGPTLTSTPTAILEPAQVVIDTVIGVGVFENEHVVLRRTGDGELSLVGWRLTDGKDYEYIFPELTLFKDGAINLNTRTGQDTVVDLFWGLTSSIWSPGEVIFIYDPQNNLRATYTLP